MAIDKSLRQHYETVEVPKTKMVEGKRHNLAYITSKEAKLLQKTGAIKTKTPEGVFAYPGGAGTPGGYGGGPGTGGGNGSADRGGKAHQATAQKAQKAARDARDTAREKAIEVAAKTVKTKAPTRHHAVDTPTQKKEQLAIDLSDFGFEDKKAKAPKTLAPPKKTYERGVPFTDELVKTVTPPKYSPTYYQDRSKIGGETWGERAEQDMNRGFFDSGIGKVLKWGATALAPQLLGPKFGQLYSGYKQAKFASDTLKQLGLTKTNLMSDLTSKSNVRDLLSRKTTATDTTTDTRDYGDNRDVRQVTPEAPKDVITENVQRFSPRQMDLVRQRHEQLRQVMQSGEYMGQRLNNNQLASLQNVSKQIEAFLVDPQKMMRAARGGIAGLHG